MTTIATDGKIMAADTMEMTSFILQHEGTKLKKVGGIVYGISGSDTPAEMYLDWVAEGCPQDNKPVTNDGWTVIFVKDGTSWLVDELLRPVSAGLPFAIGSGSVAAMAAMLCGKTPAQAIKIAMMLDAGTGGKVRTMKCYGGGSNT